MSSKAGVGARMVKAPLGFLRGISYPLKGAKLVYLQNPGLVRIWIVPVLLTFVALVTATWASWSYSDAVADWIWSEPGEWFGAGFLHGLLAFLIFVVLWIFSGFLTVTFSRVFAAPFNAHLSEKVEEILTGTPAAPLGGPAVMLRDIGRTLGLEVLKLSVYAMLMAPLFCLSFIPGVGQILFSVAGFVISAFYLGIDYVDWPAERRGWAVAERWKVALRRGLPLFGLGTGVWALLFVPVLNLFFMPAAVAGGTMLFLDLEAEDAQSRVSPS